jgi:BirA family biotin operon repressor/biotin-[acetyl-CoA-carboxylase] ligase
VRIELADEVFEGDAVGVLDDGALEVRVADGHRRTVTAGDVVHLRPA